MAYVSIKLIGRENSTELLENLNELVLRRTHTQCIIALTFWRLWGRAGEEAPTLPHPSPGRAANMMPCPGVAPPAFTSAFLSRAEDLLSMEKREQR